ncbi:MAG: hypothetical protein ACP5RI_00305 [Candidatus Micrarchaeia archaeon]
MNEARKDKNNKNKKEDNVKEKQEYNKQSYREPRCIICGKEKEGLEVQEDFVISSIRWFKRNITKNEKNYKLVVCKECYPTYYKARERYEKRRALYLVIGILFALILLIISQNKILAFIYAVIVVVFVYLLSLFTYMPAVKIPEKFKKYAKINLKD